MSVEPEFTDEEAIELDRIIRSIARGVCNDFPNVDHEDIAQDLWIWVMQGEGYIDPKTPGMKSLLWKRARALAWEVRKEQLQATAQYSYRVSDVRLILETCFDYTDWPDSFVPKDAKEGEDDGMAGLEVRIDTVIAFRRLTPEMQGYILERYRDRKIYDSQSKERKRLDRAVKRLTDHMNDYYRSSWTSGHVGRRSVINNATATYMIENLETS